MNLTPRTGVRVCVWGWCACVCVCVCVWYLCACVCVCGVYVCGVYVCVVCVCVWYLCACVCVWCTMYVNIIFYLLIKHGTIEPISNLFSQFEQTPLCLGPCPSGVQ